MRARRLVLVVAALAVSAAACGSGNDPEVTLHDASGPGDGVAVALAQQGSDTGLDPRAVAGQVPVEIEFLQETLTTVLDGVEAECAGTTTALDRESADLSDRTFIAPPDLRCAQLANASFAGAHVEDIDLTGADLRGADLSGARLRIVAVGADFTGADLTGADLTGSDLSGANLSSAILVDSNLTGLVAGTAELAGITSGGLTGADLTGAELGCNEIEGSPLMVMTAVRFDDRCADGNVDGRIDMTLSGSLLGADLTGLSFQRLHLLALDFRGARMAGVDLADYGVLPREMSFAAADLTGADLSSNTLTEVDLAGADLTGASLAASVIEWSTLVGANLTGTELSDVRSEHNDYRAVLAAGTDFRDATLSWDDFSGATFEAPLSDGVVVVAVVCDGSSTSEVDNGNSVRNFGLCTVDEDLIF